MYYPNNIVINGKAPGGLPPWVTQNVSLGSVTGVSTFVLGGTSSMKQGGELQTIDIILQPKDFKIECTFDLTQIQNMEDLNSKAFVSLTLQYHLGGKDVFTQPLMEILTKTEANWHTSTWYLPTRSDAILTDVYYEVYTYNLTEPLHIKELAVYPGMDDLDMHNLNENPHSLPLAVKVGQFGIKATKGEVVMFWLKDDGSAFFAGELHIAREDGAAEILMNPQQTVFRAKDENGVMRDRIYFDLVSGKYIFDGTLSATTIQAVSAEIDVVVSETVIVNNLYAQNGRIANLTVNHLLTGDFLSGDEYLFYIDIIDDLVEFIQAYRTDSPQEPYLDNNGQSLYWESAAHKFMTTEETEWPVMAYVYEDSVVFSIKIEEIYDTTGMLRIPVMTFGRGDGAVTSSAKGKIYKDRSNFVIEYNKSNTGDKRFIKLSDEGVIVENANGDTNIRQLRNSMVVNDLSEATAAQDGDIVFVIDTTP